MARMLYERDSLEHHLDNCRRHMRLARRVMGGEQLAESVKTPYEALLLKADTLQSLRQAKQNALDDTVFLDRQLDAAVRTTFERVSQYDRAHPGVLLMTQLFPGGTFGNITKLARTREPEEVEKLAVRLEGLGPQHPLAGEAAELRQKAAEVRQAFTALAESIRGQKAAEAEVELGCSKLRRAYEASYLDARKIFGRDLAESLFPHSEGPAAEAQTETAPAAN